MYCKMSLRSGSFPSMRNASAAHFTTYTVRVRVTVCFFYLRASTAPLQGGLWKILPGPDAAQHLRSRPKDQASHPPRQPSPHAHLPRASAVSSISTKPQTHRTYITGPGTGTSPPPKFSPGGGGGVPLVSLSKYLVNSLFSSNGRLPSRRIMSSLPSTSLLSNSSATMPTSRFFSVSRSRHWW